MSTTTRYGTRYGIAIGFVAAVALAGAAFGEAGSPAPPDGRPARAFGRIVTGTMKVQTDDGFSTRRIDAGTVTGTDGSSVTIERADGEVVSVTATDDTRISRDGARAETGDLQTGDHAIIVRLDAGDGFAVQAIHALSPEKNAGRRAQAEERRARIREHRSQMRERFREWRERVRDDAATEGRAREDGAPEGRVRGA